MNTIRILGLDPGLRHTGWGIIDVTGNHLKYVACGVINPPQDPDLGSRLSFLFQHLHDLITQFSPDHAAVEETFVNVNASSTLKLGMARGVVLLAPSHLGLTIGEYSANKVKKSVVGVGHATKEQVVVMIKRLLPTCGEDLAFDAADALAVAICHAHHNAFSVLTSRKVIAR